MYSRQVAVFGLLTLVAPACLRAAEDRIVRTVEPGRRVVLRGHSQSQPVPARRFDRGPADPAMQLDSVTLVMKPAAGLEQLLADQQNPASPDFHKWLSPDEFGRRFGITGSDTRKISAWLESQGLRVGGVARGRQWITFSGSVERVNRAFGAEIRRYEVNGKRHYAMATDPSIPEAFAAAVDGIAGMGDSGMASMNLQAQLTVGDNRYLSPDDFATIYNVKQLHSEGYDGRGQSIAVIGRTAIDLADFRAFRARFNLPANDPKLILAGADPGIAGATDVLEANLDLQWAGAVAPNADLLYVYSTDLVVALQYAVDQNLAPILSLSYGGCEQTHGTALRYLAQQANAQGITWLAASGDWGAAACDLFAPAGPAAKGMAVAWPANLPEVSGVGGTRLDATGSQYWSATNNPNSGSALSYIPERAWNDSAERGDLTAGGGGASVFVAKPVWQTGPGVPDDKARDVPDVAFTSSPQFGGYLVVTGGTAMTIGGTSAATPAFAGILALVNQYLTAKEILARPGLGNVNPMLYRLAQTSRPVFHDVTVGDNRVPCAKDSPNCENGFVGHSAGAGYDLATGLGSVDAYKLATLWTQGPATRTTVTATPNNPALDETVEIAATVSGNGDAKPTGTVTFSTGETLLGTVELTSAGASMQVSAVRIASGSGLIAAVYSGDSIFNGSAGNTTVNLAFPTSGSAVIPFITPNPVYQTSAGWVFTVRLTEKAGTATRLTSFTIDDAIAPVEFFGSGYIPAKGTVSATLVFVESGVPQNRVFSFGGVDADGKTWTRQLTVPFLGPERLPASAASEKPIQP